MDKAIAVFKISQKILGYIISLMLIGMVVVICMQTFFRYVMFRSIPGPRNCPDTSLSGLQCWVLLWRFPREFR